MNFWVKSQVKGKVQEGLAWLGATASEGILSVVYYRFFFVIKIGIQMG